MTRALPDKLVVSAQSGGRPLAGAWVRVTLVARERNDFNLLVGPTDEEGLAVATRASLMSQVQELRDLFLMDYAGLDAWSGSIRVAVLSRDDVQRALSAFETWGKAVGLRSEDDVDRLRDFGASLEQLAGKVLVAEAQVHPASAASIEPVATRA